ncbi:MAG: HNH endonuclease [Puniceicoccales bacterium]|jgi:5-methylcytosine-specific restriction endonuclease McrA|nr:HNH endonuclease [Puniceicoccales bacterium]
MSSRLQHRALVLNQAWQPVNIVGVRRAFSLLFQGHAKAIFPVPDGSYSVLNVEEWMEFSQKNPDPSHSLRSVNLALLAPPVLLLTSYDRVPRREVRFCRRNVYLRDAYRCQYCGRKFSESELTLDHVVPRDRNGKTNWENIVTACARCNARKANRLPHQAGMVLRRAPTRPRWQSFMSILAMDADASPWHPFLGISDEQHGTKNTKPSLIK